MTGDAQRRDEVFDVVDAQDRVVGQGRRSEIHARGLLHRAVHVLWLRGDGQLCLQRRSFRKDSCPGLISTSCAGHLDSGEDYHPAAVRELGEELDIRVSPEELSLIDRCPAHPRLGNEFVHVFLLRGDRAARPFPPEVDALLWRTPGELDAWLTRDPGLFSSSLDHLLARGAVRSGLGLPPARG